MSDEKRSDQVPQRNERKPSGWSPGVKPANLKPTTLRNEPARNIAPASVTPRETPARQYRDAAPPGRPITEHRPVSQTIQAKSFGLRREQERKISMTKIPISEMQMSELQSRRVGVRELGWSVPGVRIRLPDDA